MSERRGLTCGTVSCAGVAVAVAVAAWVVVTWTGSAGPAREWFAFGLGAPSGALPETLDVALTNIRLASAPYIAAWALPHVPRLRPLVDLVLAFLLVGNAACVGAAFGAYGPELASILVPHLPMELAAFSLAGGTYTAARNTPPSFRVAGCAGVASVGLLLAAAAAETALM